MIFDKWSKSYSKLLTSKSKAMYDLIGTTTAFFVVLRKPSDTDEVINPNLNVDIFGYYEPVFETDTLKSYKTYNLFIKYPRDFFVEGRFPSEMDMEEITVFFPVSKDTPLKIGDYIVDFKEKDDGKRLPIVLEVTLIKSNFLGKFLVRKQATVTRIFEYPKDLKVHLEQLINLYDKTSTI